MAKLQLNWLGPPEVQLNGQPLRLEMRKTLALLAYLSLTAQPPTRETLAALFWSEYDQQHALSNLRRNLSSLASSLPLTCLEVDRERVGLRGSQEMVVDVEQFHGLLEGAEGHAHPTGEMCPECLAMREQAVGMYRGDFFEGFNLKDCPEFDDWQFFQREGLRGEYGGVLEKLAGYYQGRGEWERAILHARSWLALDRLHEPAQRMLMRLYGQSGQKSAALRQYEECKRLLEQELGQPPEPETLHLYDEIRESTTSAVEQNPKQMTTQHAASAEIEIPIIKTKLFLPKIPHNLVRRPKLVSLLDQGAQLPLSILSASAGFGKTTLLAEWAAQSHMPVAWLGLDNADNDPHCLSAYIISAIRGILPGSSFGSEALSLLRTSSPLPIETIASSIINDLLQLPKPVVLVLDDFHLIQNKAAYELINFLLGHQPDTLRLIISTRVDPPLSLARMRANQQLFEIRTNDLRFSLEEARIFLNEVMKLAVLEEDISILSERTEGWIAGYKMASLVIQAFGGNATYSKKHQVILGLSGSHRYIMDYLVEQVLNSLPASIRSFMMRTSILERFCAPLCEAVAGSMEIESGSPNEIASVDFQPSGGGTAQEILEYLDRANMFLSPLDEERCWYRYHRLFADLLRSRMTQTASDAFIRDLHLQASSWFEQNHLISEAIQHALQGSDFDRAAQLVESYYTSTWEWSDVYSIRQWFNQLPRDAILNHPKLCGFYAYVEMLEGRLDGLDFYLDHAENRLNSMQKTDEYHDTLGILHLTRAYLAGYRGNWARAVEIVKHPLFTHPKYSSASNNLIGMALFLEGELDSACSLFEELVQDNVFLLSGSVPLSMSYIARIRKLQGQLKEAEQVYITTMSLLSERGWSRFYMPALIEFGLADLYREKNELQTADIHIRHALANTGEWFPADALATGYTVLCRILHSQGKDEDGLSCIEEARRKLEGETLLPHIQSEFATCCVQTYIAQGKIDIAGQWLQSKSSLLAIPENESSGDSFREEFERVFALRALIAEKKYRQAVELSRTMVMIAKAGGRIGRVIEIGLLQSIALYHLSRCDEALSILANSLSLANPQGYVRLFLDEGEAVQALLRLGRQQSNWESLNLCDYVDRLLIEFSK